MRISEEAKEEIKEKWTRNESDYLRERRRKVDPSAFVKLKTIGHGILSLPFCNIYRSMTNVFPKRCIRRCFSSQGTQHWKTVRYETGMYITTFSL